MRERRERELRERREREFRESEMKRIYSFETTKEEREQGILAKITMKDLLLVITFFLILVILFNSVFMAQTGEALLKTQYQQVLAEQLAELYRANPEMHLTLKREFLENLPNHTDWTKIWWQAFQAFLQTFYDLLSDFIKNFPKTMNPDYVSADIHGRLEKIHNAIEHVKK
jgi:hypothetical protein